ncbi:MAG: Ig-like domain-containing protein, partial [Thermoanaerobaculia bacterium]
MPDSLHQRFADLNQTFADAWRVTPETSLFDYAPGTSTATFTLANWPSENSSCALPGGEPATPADQSVAQAACSAINDEKARDDCVFDVLVSGDTGFAKTHLISQSIRAGATMTTVAGDASTSMIGEPVTFTATVAFLSSEANGIPAGAVRFFVDGNSAGEPVKLDATGRAKWTTTALTLDAHQISATYIVPAESAGLLPSSSAPEGHTVTPLWSNDPRN